MSLPILRYHGPTKQHYVWIKETKRRKCFGSDAAIARRRYAEWLAGRGGPASLPAPSDMTVNHALESYRRYAVERYTDSREANRIAIALNAVAELYGRSPAASFKAKALRDVRARMLSAGKNKPRSRNYINKLVNTIKTAWRWLAMEELIPAESASSVCLVRNLGPGEGGKEVRKILPPPDGAFEATLQHLPPLVRTMLLVQLLIGCRPKEVRLMRWEEISRDPARAIPLGGTGRTIAALRCDGTTVWIYSPGSHKTSWRGKPKAIPIGPAAQEQLGTPKDSGWVFTTRLGTQYRADSFARAVSRACRKAKLPAWAPNQLRHLRATELTAAFGVNVAAAVLGHAPNSTATNVYIEQAIRAAAEAQAKVG